MTTSFSLSSRYGVTGIYLDRDGRTIHVYPCLFLRVTFVLKGKHW